MMSPSERRKFLTGMAFISPWAVGFLVFCVYPLLSTACLSLTDYSVLSAPVYIGIGNYADLASDRLFWQSISNTLLFAAMSIPVGLVVSISLAVLLSFKLPGRNLFRTIYFLPSLLPLVCLGVLWQWLLNGDIGLVNAVLAPVADGINRIAGTHFRPPNWLLDPAYTKPALVIASTWTAGSAVVIYLAGLEDVPRQLYEAAEIDGAGIFRKLWHVTLPLISPVIYFNGIMALIGSMQVFAVPYVITQGTDGPDRSLMFVATYIYRKAFDYLDMGYACAVGLILFLLILGLTIAAHGLSRRYVHFDQK